MTPMTKYLVPAAPSTSSHTSTMVESEAAVLSAEPNPTGERHPTLEENPPPFTSTSSHSSKIMSNKSQAAGLSASPRNEVVQYEGLGTLESPYVVKFAEGDHDNPLEWTRLKRWYITGVVSMGTFVVAFGSSVYTGGIPQMIVYFHQTETILLLGLTLYVLGFAMGPLLWAPLSELHGRRIVLLATYTLFTLFHIGCALAHNIETMLIMRFLAGFFGSSPITNSGGVVSDVWDSSTRALALAWFALAPFAGPVLGPIIGGFLGITEDWRVIFWVVFAFSALLLGFCFTVPETYTPVLLRRRAARLSQESGHHYISIHDLKVDPDETAMSKLATAMSRPFIFLIFEPIVLAMAMYAAIVYATLYLMFPAFPIIFVEKRGWNLGEAGLPFIGIGMGMLLGIAITILYTNPKYVRELNAAGGHLPPEKRLVSCCVGGVAMPIGLISFAWTAQPSVHWIVPCLTSIPFSFGMVVTFLGMSSYLIDSYLWYCASALAANTVLRSCLGATFPLFVKGMFDRLGVNWALTLVAGLSFMMAPIPFVFWRYGARIRARSKYAPGGHPPPAPSRVADELDLERAEMGEVDEKAADEATRRV